MVAIIPRINLDGTVYPSPMEQLNLEMKNKKSLLFALKGRLA
jgi:hypothetical protein